MAINYQNLTGYVGETGVIAAIAATSACVQPGMTLMLSNQAISVVQLTCSALGTSAGSFGSIAIPTEGSATITLTKPVANMKIILTKVGGTLKLSTTGPRQPLGMNG